MVSKKFEEPNKVNDKDLYINYKISWQQDYLNWGEFVDTMTECLLESSDMKDAIAIIDKIKQSK
jgi:hypothetical protein